MYLFYSKELQAERERERSSQSRVVSARGGTANFGHKGPGIKPAIDPEFLAALPEEMRKEVVSQYNLPPPAPVTVPCTEGTKDDFVQPNPPATKRKSRGKRAPKPRTREAAGTKTSYSPFSSNASGSLCANCESDLATVDCPSCRLAYCDKCDEVLHLAKARRDHQRGPVLKRCAQCANCERSPATLFCMDCAERLCKACFAVTHMREVKRGHQRIPLSALDEKGIMLSEGQRAGAISPPAGPQVSHQAHSPTKETSQAQRRDMALYHMQLGAEPDGPVSSMAATLKPDGTVVEGAFEAPPGSRYQEGGESCLSTLLGANPDELSAIIRNWTKEVDAPEEEHQLIFCEFLDLCTTGKRLDRAYHALQTFRRAIGDKPNWHKAFNLMLAQVQNLLESSTGSRLPLVPFP